MRVTELLTALWIAMTPSLALSASVTGEVRAIEAQPIYTPPSNSSPVVLRYYVADGTAVKKGDPILRIDPGQAGARLRTLAADLEKAQAKAEAEIAEQEVKAIDAELAYVEAEALVAKARIDAALPRELLSGLDFDRYRGDLERAERDLVLKRDRLREAREAVERRRTDAELEIKRMRLEQEYQQAQLANAEVLAARDGVVMHGFDPWSGQRFDEGSSAQMGQMIGEVAPIEKLGVRAYALESERDAFHRGDLVVMDFDALPGLQVMGKIENISGAPEARQVWGMGRYFSIDIRFEREPMDARVLPGMSVRVRAPPAPPQVARKR